MYLKKVEIFGFKSFANKTVLEFLPASNFCVAENADGCGITAIVGPNGSGKSNVSDAIKWAMGEQSMKTLRGKKSEDVIFSGSGKKARLSSAWVTLHFDNSDKRIPLEFADVIITRKIFRSGESEYLINGSRSRLLDVAEILAKAGVGKESYCVINQGMSDSVLSVTPIERRAVLEEAAGVKQYQIKKERSLRKMESSQENLQRVSGLMQEIEPHLKMLKRQAEKAQQGREVAAQLKEKQTSLFAYLWHAFQSERNVLLKEKDVFQQQMKNLQDEVEKINVQLNKESSQIEDSGVQEKLEKSRSELRSQLNEVERELIITEGRVVVERERLANQKIMEIIPVDLIYVQQRLKKIRAQQEKLIERVENAENMEQLQDIKEFARVIQQQLHDLHEEAGKGEVAIKKDNSQEEKEIKDKIAVLEERKKVAEQKEMEFKEKINIIEKEITAEILRSRKARENFFELERELRSRQDELNKLRDVFNDAKVKLARVEVREEDLVGEIRNQLKCEVNELKFDGKEISREQLEREIYRLKMQMEQIGGIDPMIVDEYHETNARFDFLTKESEDLAKAIVSLAEVVKEMDRKINQEFDLAFEKINAGFMKYFQIIFGGGNAHLLKIKSLKRKVKSEILEGDSDELQISEDENSTEENEKSEIGVEIFACPPGKKINNLSMLSGGERSLTSLALLFAIIAHNPPPFAILDEVEAALDEANSRRFSKILQELSASTQFIAITHNRETMRQAALLYGVTMGEEGVSRLLSVRFDQIGQGGRIKGE